MKDTARTIIGVLVGVSLSFPALASDFKEGEVIVKFKAPPNAARSVMVEKESRAVAIAVDDTKAAISEMQGRPDIEYVEPNYIIKAEYVPNDWPYPVPQWGDVYLPEAWDLMEKSGPGQVVVIAVVDSGADADHPDLEDILTRGYDFANNDSVPEDDAGHGTRVCGIIGATGNNGSGIAGVAWNTSIEIMPVKFMKNNQGETTGKLSDAVNAIYYAVDNGADIINASWGFTSYSRSLEESIRYARDHGVLFVASAGNDGQDNDVNAHYPSNYDLDNVIAVAAMNSTGELASFSNYGLNSVDLAAPGVGLSSTDIGGGYVSWISGTSYASPFVAAVAAMVKSRAPEMSCQNLRNIVIGSAAKKDGYKFDALASGGCVNAYQSLLAEESFYDSSNQSGSSAQTQEPASEPAASSEGGGGGCLIGSCQNSGSASVLLVLMTLAVLFRISCKRHPG